MRARFNDMFALTWLLLQNDDWMQDNELYEPNGECAQAVKRLAATWRDLLAHSNEELGIDPDFTRPGVEAMLDKFASELSTIERGNKIGYKFAWRP